MTNYLAIFRELDQPDSQDQAPLDKRDKRDKSPSATPFGTFGTFDAEVSDFEEPAAATENSAEVPQEWLQGVSRLWGMSPPATVAPDSWAAFLESCEAFMAGPWPGKAASMGWTADSLFGCHGRKPVERVDRMGLLWLLGTGRIAALTEETAVIEMPSGSRLTYRVHPIREPSDVLAWEFLCAPR